MGSVLGSAVFVNTTPSARAAVITLLAMVSVDTGCMGDEARPQRSRVYLSVKLHIDLLSMNRKIEGLEIPSGKSSLLEFY